MIEAIKVAKADIYRYVGDPKFTVVPTAGMLSKDYAAKRRALIDIARAGPYPDPGEPARLKASPSIGREKEREPFRRTFPEQYDAEQHTTSFSIVDGSGNAVAVTPTLGGLFGNNVVVGSTGVLLINLIDFDLPVQQDHRSAAVRARRQPEFLQAGRRDQGPD